MCDYNIIVCDNLVKERKRELKLKVDHMMSCFPCISPSRKEAIRDYDEDLLHGSNVSPGNPSVNN